MDNFRTIDRDTPFLLPPSVDEWLPQRHLARFVVEVVQGCESGLSQGRSEHLGEIVRAPSGSFSPKFESSLVVYGAHEIDREVSDDGHVGRAVAFA